MHKVLGLGMWKHTDCEMTFHYGRSLIFLDPGLNMDIEGLVFAHAVTSKK